LAEKDTKILRIFAEIYEFLRKSASPFTRLFSWASDYTGSKAELVKVIPVLMVAGIITLPLWSLPIYMWIAIVYGEPLNYIVYTAWIAQLFVILLVNAYYEYLKKHRGSE
jgi:hypothetical protein